jgi:hypothetical protein
MPVSLSFFSRYAGEGRWSMSRLGGQAAVVVMPQSGSQENRNALAVKHLALLRGVNVGGKNKLQMANQMTMFEEAGREHVRASIGCGNVPFGEPPGIAAWIHDLSAAVSAKQINS